MTNTTLSNGAFWIVNHLSAETNRQGMEALEDAEVCADILAKMGLTEKEVQDYIEEAHDFYRARLHLDEE